MTVAEHKKLVQERKARSLTWKIIHAFGSLKLALFLIATIALACAVATFIEAELSTKVAHAYIYSAPWFSAWLGLFMINLIAVTLTRWPWLPKHLGFVITHYGIVVLLIGAMIGAKLGFEGNVTLTKGETKDKLIARETVLYVQTLNDWAMTSFDPEATRPREDRPRRFAVQGSRAEVVVDRFAPGLEKVETIEPAPEENAPAGVALRFRSPRLQQEVEVGLLAAAGNDTHDFFGMTEVQLVSGFEPTQGTPTRRPVRWQEAHMAIESAPGAPTFHVEEGERSGFTPIVEVGKSGHLLHIVAPDGGRVSFRLLDIVGKVVEVPSARVEVLNVWPDFDMEDGKPISRSEEMRNVAALVRLSGDEITVINPKAGLALELDGSTVEEGAVRYRFLRDGSQGAEGALRSGEVIATGWADWTVEVVRAHPKARKRAEWRERADFDPRDPKVAPGIRARLRVLGEGEGEPAWIGSGSHVFLNHGNHVVRTGFGNRLVPLDFKLTLESFEVPRLPGTDKPANFISTIRFEDPKTGQSHVGVAKMNHPASFPSGLWGQISGQTFKFSQAQWNPENLDETTLQVLYDPGWLAKWIGSLMICVGIGVMFYLRPAQKSPSAEGAAAESDRALSQGHSQRPSSAVSTESQLTVGLSSHPSIPS